MTEINNDFIQSKGFIGEIYNEDFRTILPQIQKDSVDLILTDPPYDANRMKNAPWGHRPNHIISADWDIYDKEEYLDLIDDFFTESARVIKDGGTLVTFVDARDLSRFYDIGMEHGFWYKNVLTWHKTNPFPANMDKHFLYSTEHMLYFVYNKKVGTFNNNGKPVHSFIETGLTPRSEKKFGNHQAQKPLKVIRWLIETLSNEGDLVLDPFMGSGTTCVACEELNRKYIGIEILPEFYEIASKRLSE